MSKGFQTYAVHVTGDVKECDGRRLHGWNFLQCSIQCVVIIIHGTCNVIEPANSARFKQKTSLC